MNASNRYDLVTLVHVSADIVFIIGLLAGALVLAALTFQSASELAKERRLIAGMLRWNRVVTGTALLFVWGCGLWLAWQAGWWHSGWLQLKAVLVFVLSGVHGGLTRSLRRACADAPELPSRAWRVTPALALGAIVAVLWLALMKPF